MTKSWRPDWKLFRRSWAFGCAVCLFLIVSGSLGVSQDTLMILFSPGLLLADSFGYGRDDGQTYILIFGVCSVVYGLPAYLFALVWREAGR